MTAAPISAAVELVLDCADGREARRLSRQLLKRRLIASSSILPKEQTSRWADGMHKGSPVTLMLVTRHENVEYVTALIRSVMNHTVPVSITEVGLPSDGTIEWVDTVRHVRAETEGI